MNWRKITAVFMIAATAIIIGYDIWVVVVAGGSATISNVFINFSWEHATLPWAWGVLTGHLTWPTKAKMDRWEHFLRLGTMVMATLVLLVLDIQSIIPRVMPVIPMAFGVCVGHLGWPQKLVEEKKA